MIGWKQKTAVRSQHIKPAYLDHNLQDLFIWLNYLMLKLRLSMLLASQIILLAFLSDAFAQADGGYDLSPRIQNRIIGIERDYELSIQSHLTDYRLIKEVESFSPIEGRSVDVPVKLSDLAMGRISRVNSPQVVATLHDRRTGAPLDSCHAPCSLLSPLVPPGIITLYRYGSKPMDIPVESIIFSGEIRPLWLNFNEVDHQIERERCAEEFERIRNIGANKDAAPCFRFPPTMPRVAKRSGHCVVTLNVAKSGEAVDVVARECTDPVYCEPTVEAVRRWIYYPKLEYREVVERQGVTTKMTFRLTDAEGNVIPEPEEDMQPCIGHV